MNDEVQAEMRSNITALVGTTASIKTTLEFHGEFLERMEGKIDNLPANCGTGIDHEKRIRVLEGKPDRALEKKSLKVGNFSGIGGFIVSTIAVIIALLALFIR